MIWWILPAVCGVVGLMLGFAGFGKLFRLKPFSGLSRLVGSAGLLGLGGVVAFAGLNLQTYKRLTYERPVATISFAATETPEVFTTQVIYEGGEEETYELKGDEWELNARVAKFKPLSNMLGFDSIYKLDRLYGQFDDDDRVQERVVKRLSENPGLDVLALAKQSNGFFGNVSVDAYYGSGVYNPMADGLSYTVWMDQRGLFARADNDATRRVVRGGGKPGPDATKGEER